VASGALGAQRSSSARAPTAHKSTAAVAARRAPLRATGACVEARQRAAREQFAPGRLRRARASSAVSRSCGVASVRSARCAISRAGRQRSISQLAPANRPARAAGAKRRARGALAIETRQAGEHPGAGRADGERLERARSPLQREQARERAPQAQRGTRQLGFSGIDAGHARAQLGRAGLQRTAREEEQHGLARR